MEIPCSFLALIAHPAPWLHFPAHDGAGTPERIVPAPHRFGRPADEQSLALLRELTAPCPAARDQLVEFYSRWNGFELCRLPDAGEIMPLLELFCIADWKGATAELESGDLSFVLDDLEEVLPRDGYLTIGGASSEGTRLLLSLSGTWDGLSTAGAICYAAMDPVLGIGEPIAGSFFELLEQIAADPARFFERISSTYFVEKGANMWGDVADCYIPDIGGGAANNQTAEGDDSDPDPRQLSLFPGG